MTAEARTAAEGYRSRVRGCLLGGAIGDALGAPLEFLSLEQIRAAHGDGGVREYVPTSVGDELRHGLVTDDTQMTLFTAEGIIRAGVREDRGIGFTVAVVHSAYDRWLDTQLLPEPPQHPNGFLHGEQWLYQRRAPGKTCLTALTTARDGGRAIFPYDHAAANDSKGCGGVMRSAPFGLLPRRHPDHDTWVFDFAAKAAGYTHGHPTGKLASGALAAIVARLVDGDDLRTAVAVALAALGTRVDHEETSSSLREALAAAERGSTSAAAVEALGAGWVAEEALAIAVYAALAHPDPDEFLEALALAVTHSGDSDSTGAICGSILGAWHGETALPPELAFEVEGRGTILQLADDFVWEFTTRHRLHGEYGPHTRWTGRYPGG